MSGATHLAVVVPGSWLLESASAGRTGIRALLDLVRQQGGRRQRLHPALPRRRHDIVQAAQEAAVKVTKPGKRFLDPHEAATRVLVEGMLDTGLLPKAKHGKVDDVLESGAYRQFYMHRTGHWMGMDVHDCGDYTEPGSKPREEKDALGQTVMRKPSRVLKPGMVLTIDPGIYVRPAKGVPKEFWNIGIRIEDDALVTAKGCELMTRGVPVKADEIEALMRG